MTKTNAALLEAIGFTLVLMAAVFQWKFNDWFNTETGHYQFHVLNELQLELNSGIGDLALVNAETDTQKKSVLAQTLHARMFKANTDAFYAKRNMDGPFKKQASNFGLVRFVIFLLGSISIISAKIVNYTALKAEAKASVAIVPKQTPEPTPATKDDPAPTPDPTVYQ